jgi:hypothetical protein
VGTMDTFGPLMRLVKVGDRMFEGRSHSCIYWMVVLWLNSDCCSVVELILTFILSLLPAVIFIQTSCRTKPEKTSIFTSHENAHLPTDWSPQRITLVSNSMLLTLTPSLEWPLEKPLLTVWPDTSDSSPKETWP